MSDPNENLLAKVIIESTKYNSTDMALERMTNTAVKANLNAQVNLARFQQGRMNGLERDVDSLKMDIQSTNTEKRHLQAKLKYALEQYEEANNNTGSWIELLNKPLYKIAEQHEGFNENYTNMLRDFSKIVLTNMTQSKTIDYMAEELEYSPIEVDILKYRFEGEVLKEQQITTDDEFENQLVKNFMNELIDDNKKKHAVIKSNIAKSSKTYK